MNGAKVQEDAHKRFEISQIPLMQACRTSRSFSRFKRQDRHVISLIYYVRIISVYKVDLSRSDT